MGSAVDGHIPSFQTHTARLLSSWGCWTLQRRIRLASHSLPERCVSTSTYTLSSYVCVHSLQRVQYRNSCFTTIHKACTAYTTLIVV